MGKVTITYNGAVISEAEETAPVTVQYHGSTIATLGAGESRTLSCGGKYMRSDLIIGSKTLSCGGKKMASDIGLAAEADKVEDDTITYTGAMTDQIVLMSNVAYRLLTLTSSGTLTISNSRKADVWMCNGGNGGYAKGSYGGASPRYSGPGGGGGYVTQNRITISGSVACTIGAGGAGGKYDDLKSEPQKGGTTTFREISPGAQPTSALDGASGGGAGYTNPTFGKGNGKSTMPFSGTPGEHSFLKYHSAGGGGGGSRVEKEDDNGEWYTDYRYGGNGGSSGSNGSENGNSAGGNNGGGAGEAYGEEKKDATFYGSGGGGSCGEDGNYGKDTGGSGYQGIIYVRIPLDQSIYN